jgi:hypothetical protein
VFECNQNKRHVLESAHFYVPHCLGQLRDAVGEKHPEDIARHDEHSKIYSPLQKLISQVNEVHRNQVASTRNLKFHANANMPGTAIDCLLF